MLISEIFYSIQGEGILTGIPSVFVRLSGCNLRCSWCDTRYSSWEPEGEQLGIDEIITTIDHYNCKHVVITGGEPMLFKELQSLTKQLYEQKFHITIETAATIMPEGVKCDLASLSPKLQNSDPLVNSISPSWIKRHQETRLQIKVIQRWIEEYSYQLKFVVMQEQDIEEILGILKNIEIPVPVSNILLMPQGRSTEELQKNALWIIEFCKKYGFRYTPRLHIDLYGNVKGV